MKFLTSMVFNYYKLPKKKLFGQRRLVYKDSHPGR